MPTPLDLAAIVPIVTLDRIDHAVPLAHALAESGIDAMEITLRTPAALGAIEAIAKALPSMRVGAATVLRPTDITSARNAGARFLVSPGLTPDLAAAGLSSGLPYLPGAATASEVMAARELGFSFLTFFPAAESGGIGFLRALAPVLPGVAFCPAADVTLANAAAYLALPNVPSVGSTWIASRDAIAARDWRGVTERARQALELVKIVQ